MTKRWMGAFAVQYKQDLRVTEDDASNARAMEWLFGAYVAPRRVRDRPTLVILNEDIGLLTAFIGMPGDIQCAFGLVREAHRPQVIHHYLPLFPLRRRPVRCSWPCPTS